MHHLDSDRAHGEARPGKGGRPFPVFLGFVFVLFLAACPRVCLAQTPFDETVEAYVILAGNGAAGRPLNIHSLSGRGKATAASYQLLAKTANQSRVARALDSLPADDPLRVAVNRIAASDAHAAYDRLGGAHYANLPGLMQQRDVGFGFGLLRRQSSLVAKMGFTDNPVVPAVVPTPELPPPPACDPCAEFAKSPLALPSLVLPVRLVSQMWAQIDTDRYSIDSDGNGPKSKLTGSSLSLGYEFATACGWLGGVAFRYSDTTLKTKSLASESNLDSFAAALYAGKVLTNDYGPFRMSLGTSYARHLIKTSRGIQFEGFSEGARARHHADSFQVFAEAAQSLYAGRAVVEPFLAAAWSHLRTGNVRERGGAATLGQRVGNHDHLYTTLGVRAYMPLSERFGVDASAGWRHLYGRRRPVADMYFRSGGESFGMQGTASDRDALVVSAALDYVLYPSLTVRVGYDGSVGDRGSSHAGQLRLTYGF